MKEIENKIKPRRRTVLKEIKVGERSNYLGNICRKIPEREETSVISFSSFNIRFVPFPVVIYMFKVSNRNNETRCEICSKLTIRHQYGTIVVVLVSLLLTLNIFYTLF